MSSQMDFVPPMRRKRLKASTPENALERATVMIDWYKANRPSVRRLSVFPKDYKYFEENVGKQGISITSEGIRYRDFTIVCAAEP